MAYTHILAPTDFSATANEALHLAFEEATQHHAKLTLLYVLHHQAATELYYVKGSPADHSGFTAEFGENWPSAPLATPEVIRRDYLDEAMGQLRDLVPASFKQGAVATTGRLRGSGDDDRPYGAGTRCGSHRHGNAWTQRVIPCVDGERCRARRAARVLSGIDHQAGYAHSNSLMAEECGGPHEGLF